MIKTLFLAAWTITLAWSPPTVNIDGTLIDDLAGFHIYQSDNAGMTGAVLVGTLTNGVVRVPSIGQSYQMEITPGTNQAWFAATAFDLSGSESDMSASVHWYDAPPGPPVVRVTIAVDQ